MGTFGHFHTFTVFGLALFDFSGSCYYKFIYATNSTIDVSGHTDSHVFSFESRFT